jgi:hypothetical protein
MKVTGRQRRRLKQLLDDHKENTNLKGKFSLEQAIKAQMGSK